MSHRHYHGHHGGNDMVGCLIGLILTFFIAIITVIVELFSSGNRAAKGVAWGIIAILIVVYYLIEGGFSSAALIVFGIGAVVVMIILSLIPADGSQGYMQSNSIYNDEYYNKYNPEEDSCRDVHHVYHEHSFDNCFDELESNVEVFLDEYDSVDDFDDFDL